MVPVVRAVPLQLHAPALELVQDASASASSMFTRVPAPTRRLLGSVVAAPRRLIATRGADRPLRVAIAGAGVSGSILASALAKHPNVRVTMLERFARGALPPGLNLLINHNGMGALSALDAELATAVRAVGEPMVSWSAATL